MTHAGPSRDKEEKAQKRVKGWWNQDAFKDNSKMII